MRPTSTPRKTLAAATAFEAALAAIDLRLRAGDRRRRCPQSPAAAAVAAADTAAADDVRADGRDLRHDARGHRDVRAAADRADRAHRAGAAGRDRAGCCRAYRVAAVAAAAR